MKKGTREDVRMMVALVVIGGAAIYLLRQNLKFPDFSLPSVSDFVPSTDTVRDSVGNVGGYLNAAGVGAVEGIGLAVGIPRTDVSKCAQDKAAGRWWDASFSCPAGDFLSSGAAAVFGSTNVSQATQADVRRVDNAYDYRTDANPFVNQAGYDFRYF
ncbi:MAG: hypothetical protein V4645_27850 [Pseudomonadota bacterium]